MMPSVFILYIETLFNPVSAPGIEEEQNDLFAHMTLKRTVAVWSQQATETCRLTACAPLNRLRFRRKRRPLQSHCENAPWSVRFCFLYRPCRNITGATNFTFCRTCCDF